MSDELTIESALKELREMGFMRYRIELIHVFDSDFPHDIRVTISIWRREQGGKVIHGKTLDEAAAQVRAWHKSQQKEQSK